MAETARQVADTREQLSDRDREVPMLVKRLRRLRASRQRQRSARRLGLTP